MPANSNSPLSPRLLGVADIAKGEEPNQLEDVVGRVHERHLAAALSGSFAQAFGIGSRLVP